MGWGEQWAGRLLAPAAALLALVCASCTDYLARRDAMTPGTGDAVLANAAVHVIDPWPRRSRKVDELSDGQRMAQAVERYRNPASGTTAGATAPVPVAPSAAPSTQTLR